jgi:hypothetical protein
MKKIILCLAFAFTLGKNTNAQVNITDSLSNADVANLLTGFGVNISNLTIECDLAAIGELNGASMVPISQGLLLSTGNVNNFIYGSPFGFTSFTQQFTDPDINLISSALYTQDLCKLEFDCLPLGDTLLFNFAFGSEEYPNFVGTNFNDAFAIFMSGPGISGLQNVAQLPNGDVVSINNVNAGINSSYFIDNAQPATTGLTYGGFTQNLQVFALSTPGSTYHFKVMITDVSDGILDSGVLLEAFSFRSPTNAVTGLIKGYDTQIKLFPNPSNGSLTIKDIQFDGIAKAVTITDLSGRLVQEFTMTQSVQQLDLSNIADGMYHINIKDSKSITNYPLVVKK